MDLLLIFVKNPRLGKVKTRLAATVGNRKALRIYLKLLERTRAITQPLSVVKTVYYTPEILTDDQWDSAHYRKAQQQEGDLGERMHEAFRQGFAQGYQRVCIIGSDCYELTTVIIEQAFEQLETHDVVIGPSTDGGYYLLGMNQLYPALFKNKLWSSTSVTEATVGDVKAMNLRYAMLPSLTDVDDEGDLGTIR